MKKGQIKRRSMRQTRLCDYIVPVIYSSYEMMRAMLLALHHDIGLRFQPLSKPISALFSLATQPFAMRRTPVTSESVVVLGKCIFVRKLE